MGLLPAMRPRRAFVVERAHPDLLRHVKDEITDPDCPCHGMLAGNHLELLIDVDARHFWSPWLSVDLLPEGEGTRVKCRYGPHPSVWTGIVSAYAFLAFAALASVVFGSTQLLVGYAPWGFVVLPIAIGLAVALYIGSQIGQRLGAEQMHVLDDVLDGMLDHAVAET